MKVRGSPQKSPRKRTRSKRKKPAVLEDSRLNEQPINMRASQQRHNAKPPKRLNKVETFRKFQLNDSRLNPRLNRNRPTCSPRKTPRKMLLNNQMQRMVSSTITSQAQRTNDEVIFVNDAIPSTSNANGGRRLQNNEVINIIDSGSEPEDNNVGNDGIMEFVDRLIDESFVNITKAQTITNGHDENKDPESMDLFYVDKNSAFKFSEIPKYTTKEFSTIQTAKERTNGAASSSVVANETSIICLDSTCESAAEESIILLNDDKNIKKYFVGAVEKQYMALPKPKFLESPAIASLYKLIPMNDSPLADESPDSARKRRRCRRGKTSSARKKRNWDKLQSRHGLGDGTQNTAPTQTNDIAIENEQSPMMTAPSVPQISVVPKETTRKVKRVIIIDGSNVAMGARKEFDRDSHMDYCVEGLKKCIDHFENLGFEAKAVVPEYRMRREKSSNWPLINELKTQGKVVCTPSKSYDDRVILNAAKKLDAAVVSNDLFRDLFNENVDYREIIQSRVIRFTWLFDQIFITEDPYGRYGPKLDEILYRTEKNV